MLWIPILLFFTIMKIQSGLQHDQPTCRICAKNKRLYISQYIDIVLIFFHILVLWEYWILSETNYRLSQC